MSLPWRKLTGEGPSFYFSSDAHQLLVVLPEQKIDYLLLQVHGSSSNLEEVNGLPGGKAKKKVVYISYH